MIAADPLHHHGGVKALTGHVLLQAMGQLEQRFSDIQTPYLLILGADDKICNVEASKVIILGILYNICQSNSFQLNENRIVDDEWNDISTNSSFTSSSLLSMY